MPAAALVSQRAEVGGEQLVGRIVEAFREKQYGIISMGVNINAHGVKLLRVHAATLGGQT
jgi:hypothetical protein